MRRPGSRARELFGSLLAPRPTLILAAGLVAFSDGSHDAARQVVKVLVELRIWARKVATAISQLFEPGSTPGEDDDLWLPLPQPAAAMSTPERKRQVRQRRADVDALHELVARGILEPLEQELAAYPIAPRQLRRDGRPAQRKPR